MKLKGLWERSFIRPSGNFARHQRGTRKHPTRKSIALPNPNEVQSVESEINYSIMWSKTFSLLLLIYWNFPMRHKYLEIEFVRCPFMCATFSVFSHSASIVCRSTTYVFFDSDNCHNKLTPRLARPVARAQLFNYSYANISADSFGFRGFFAESLVSRPAAAL